MFHKHCPHCQRTSYSATDHGQWLCPYCGKDITNETLYPVDKRQVTAKDSRDGE